MFNTIVVGIDGREGGRDALALGERLRRLFGGELVAVHAYPYDFFVPRGSTPDFESVLHGNAQGLIADEARTRRDHRSHDGAAGRLAGSRFAHGGQVARKPTSSWSARTTAARSGAYWRAT